MANSVSHAALPYPVRGCRFTVLIPYLNNKGEPEDPVAPDTERSIDGAAFADCTEELTVLTGSNGMGYITLTGDELNGALVGVAAKVASGPKPTLLNLYSHVLATLFSGTASAGAAGSITLVSPAPAVADLLIGCIVRTTGGTGGGGGSGSLNNQARVITAYTSGRVASVTPNWETAPDATTTYEILLAEAALIRYADVKLWAATATASDDVALKATLAKGTDITGFNDLAAGDIRTAVGLAAANLDTQLAAIAGYIDTEVAAIKAKTDQLTFTLTNKLDASIQAAGDFAQGAADKVWLSVLEGAHTAGDVLRIALAAVSGKSSKVGNVFKYRDVADAKDRLDVTTDGAGSRTTITTRDGT